LLAAVVNGNSDAASPVKPLSAEVSAVMQAADNHPFVKQVVSSLPAKALERGVYSEETLIERFATVQRVCRRVAMVDERGGSVPRYLLSYIQSLFVFSRPPRAALDKSAGEGEVDSDDILVDVKALTTFDIVDEAQNALRAGRLDLAVRLVNQLRGEPRRVASDWINDARLLLEARQASHALLAFSAATGAGATY
jgi:mitofilin